MYINAYHLAGPAPLVTKSQRTVSLISRYSKARTKEMPRKGREGAQSKRGVTSLVSDAVYQPRDNVLRGDVL